MSTTSASYLVLPFLNPKTLALYNLKPTSFSLLSSSSNKPHAKPLSISTSFFHSFQHSCSSPFVRNSAVSSEFDVLSDDEGSNFSPDLKLFVGNLPFSVDSEQLAGLFETAGNVEMVEVIYDKVTGRSRGFAFVTMSSAEEVEAAARKFNDYELDGRPLRVNSGPPPSREEFSSRPRGGGREEFSSRPRGGGREEFSSRPRGGGREEFSSRPRGGGREEFSSRPRGGGREEFSSRGPRPRGGGREEFSSRGPRSWGGGREEFSSRGPGLRGGGREEFSSRGPRGGGREEFSSRGPRGGGGESSVAGNRVYVGNLSWGVDDLALETLFSEQGKVVEAKVVYDRESGRSRGFGFVTYRSTEEVDNAIDSLNGVDLGGRSIRVTAAEARTPRRQF